jgi:hypothetical protein
MNTFRETNEALRELRVACRQLACANLRARMMLVELRALSPADSEGFARVVAKYERKAK